MKNKGTNSFRGTTLLPATSVTGTRACVTYNIRHFLLVFQKCSSRGKFDCRLNLGKLAAGDLPSLTETGSLLCTVLAFISCQ